MEAELSRFFSARKEVPRVEWRMDRAERQLRAGMGEDAHRRGRMMAADADGDGAGRGRPAGAAAARGVHRGLGRRRKVGRILAAAAVLGCLFGSAGGTASPSTCQHQWDIDDCMECEKITIEGRKRILSFCKVMDTTTTVAENKREITAKDVYWTGTTLGIKEESHSVWQWKSVMRECILNASYAGMRKDDYTSVIQFAMYNPMGTQCGRIADQLCERMGAESVSSEIHGATLNWVEVPSTSCCEDSRAKESWTLDSQEQWMCKCGSGVRRGNEQCDDGNLQKEDGCNEWCQVETSLGYSCTEPTVELDYSAATPPDRKSVCQCGCDCTQFCTCQNKANRDFCGVRDDGALISNTEIICCPPYVP